MKKYIVDFMPQGFASWFYSLTVLLGTLNYFFGSSFAAKDNWDVFNLAMSGRQASQLLELDITALFLDRLYLDVTLYTQLNKEEQEIISHWKNLNEKIEIYKKYINSAYHSSIKGNKFVFEGGGSMELIDELVQERIAKSDIKFEYETTRESIIAGVKNNQKLKEGGVLFVLGLNRHILYDETPKSKSDNGGHVLVSTGVDKDNNFILYEPISPRPNPRLIAVDKVLDAIHDLGGYGMLIVKDNPAHQ